MGIGASAGGLEALEQFLERVPVDSGMAFIIVQHLDPTRKGIMPELLQRSTPLLRYERTVVMGAGQTPSKNGLSPSISAPIAISRPSSMAKKV